MHDARASSGVGGPNNGGPRRPVSIRSSPTRCPAGRATGRRRASCSAPATRGAWRSSAEAWELWRRKNTRYAPCAAGS